MPASLYVRRADGREENLPSLELSEAIQIFNAIPWQAEIAAWKAFPPEARDEHEPLFILNDDTGKSLRVAADSDESISFTFDYPSFRPQFGFAFIDGQDSVSAGSCPRGELENLFTNFFNDDSDAIFSLTAKYPAPQSPENS